MFPGEFDPLGYVEGLIDPACPDQRTHHTRQSLRAIPGGLDPLGHIHRVLGNPPRPTSFTRPGQRTRHFHQSLRTIPGGLDPLGHAHRFLGDPPRPTSFTRPGQRTRQLRQSLRTRLKTSNLLSHIFGNNKSKCDYMNIFVRTENIFR